ncbi:MAG: hypothetical protein QOI38_55 [Sphingomonadales bacterium]|jgi:hypothetical protein|nr:hypothetical protein [Sphingomonadales bacterium]
MYLIGLALLFVGGFSLLLMEATQSVPGNWPWWPVHRDEDPEAYRRWRLAYAAMAGLGALAVLADGIAIVLLRLTH